MRHLLRLSLCALGFAAASQSAPAREAPAAPASKPAEFRTVLPPQLSSPLSVAQIAKRALASAPAPATTTPAPALLPGGKAEPFSTILPPDPALAGARALASAAKLAALARASADPTLPRAAGGIAAPAKPPDLVTARPADPTRVGAAAERFARKAARGSSAAATPGGRKPQGVETRGTAPTALSPAQLAKRAQAEAGRQP